jgi:hypothetical protein
MIVNWSASGLLGRPTADCAQGEAFIEGASKVATNIGSEREQTGIVACDRNSGSAGGIGTPDTVRLVDE